MGSEGRYHLRRSLSKGGVDLLVYDKMSNSITPKTIKYNGGYWEMGKDEAIFFEMDSMKNPESMVDKKDKNTALAYNESIAKTPRWKANRRPVLLATEELCFTFTPDFINFLSQSVSKYDKNELIDIENPKSYTSNMPNKNNDDNTPFYSFLLDLAKKGYGSVKKYNPINIQLVTDYIDAMSARYASDTYLSGKISGINFMTKPKRPLITTTQFIIGAAAILAIVILVIVLQKGGIPNIMPK